jgi:methyltransferase (TIGR00027 family)
MTEVKDVRGTAFVVAEFRARENEQAHPLYRDPIVHVFLDDRSKKAAAAIRANFPAGEKMPRLRTRYFDDRLDEHIADGCRQVVILGSGLDTRPVRKRAPGVTYFEIDEANTLNFKKERYAANGIDAPVTFIPGDYVAAGVLPLLKSGSFDTGLPSFFIWEGNTMYLTRAAAMKVLADLRGNVRDFAISFDYMDEVVVARATGDPQTTGFVERFAAMGAPWHYGIDDLNAVAQATGMAVADKTTIADLYRSYWPNEPLDSIIYEHYSLCTLTPA